MLTYPTPFNPASTPVIPGVCDLPLSRFTVVAKQLALANFAACMDWSDDGMHMYYGVGIDNVVFNYNAASIPWEIDDLGDLSGFRPESFADTDGVRVKPDGTEVWLTVHTGLSDGVTISYTLPAPYTWTTTGPDQPVLIDAIINARIDIGAEFKHLNDLNISPDGTKLISWGNDTLQFPYQQDMTAWDVSTLVYGPDNAVITASDCFIPKSGDCMYISSGRAIDKYAFGSSWDLVTLGSSIIDTIDLTATISADITAIFITNDRLFVIDGSNELYQYNA